MPNFASSLRHTSLLGALAVAAALVGCAGDGSSATNSATPITSGTSPPPGSSSGTATLSWTAPTENTDGSVLANLSGYVIRYGTVPNNLSSSITISNPGITTYVVDNLPVGTYYFTLSALTTSGVQSSASNEVSATIS